MYSLGAEIYGQANFNDAVSHFNASTAAPVIQNINISYHTKMKYVYGLRVLPGIVVGSNALLYGILGVGVAHFNNKFNASYSVPIVSDALGVNRALSRHRTQNKTAGQIGAGIEFAAACNLGVGVRYVYSYYGHMRNNLTSVTVPGTDPGTFFNFAARGSRTVANHEVALELNYYLG